MIDAAHGKIFQAENFTAKATGNIMRSFLKLAGNFRP